MTNHVSHWWARGIGPRLKCWYCSCRVSIGEERWAPDIGAEFLRAGAPNAQWYCGRDHGEVNSERNLRCKGYSKDGIAMGWSVDRRFM